MKKLIGLLAVVAVVSCASAQVRYGVESINLSTNRVGAQSATNFNNVVDVRKQDLVSFQLTFQADAATTDNLTFVFYRSVDGSTYATAGEAIALALTGNTARTVVTNITTTGIGFVKLAYITNAAASAVVTNVTAKYAVKIGS